MIAPPHTPSDTTLAQIARLYYLENRSQQEIANEINVSRSLVALYLKRARERGIVSFVIRDPHDDYEYLESYLVKRSGVPNITVVPTASNAALTRRSVASALARYLEDNLQDDDVLGLGFGRTIHELPTLIAPRRLRNIRIVPLMGESAFGYTRSFSQINQVILQISQAFDATPHFLLAPLLVETPELCKMLLQDKAIREVNDLWSGLDQVCIGIGTVPPIEGEVVYLGEENIKHYLEKGAVGDTCTRYFNSSGEYLKMDLHDRTIAISFDQLRQARHVNVVASGIDKADAVCAFLKSGMVSHLFVDEDLAKVMIRKLAPA